MLYQGLMKNQNIGVWHNAYEIMWIQARLKLALRYTYKSMDGKVAFHVASNLVFR